MAVHPSKAIIGTKSELLKGKTVVLCICGSVAAVKSPEIARELMRNGADVHAVMSREAMRIMHPHLMEWATGNPVVTRLTGKVEHIALCEGADLVIVAPATANTISKIAHGICDTAVTIIVSTALGRKIPVIIAPAMHESLYKNPFVSENVEKLKRSGIVLVEPEIEGGRAKIASTSRIVGAVINLFTPRSLEGRKVLITAGPTREHMDDVKFLSTPSSGKMGIALAEECAAAGADVTLVLGPTFISPPQGVRVVNVISCEEMMRAVLSLLEERYDIIFLSAAPPDFTFSERQRGKISSDLEELNVKLVKSPRIISEVRKHAPDSIIVGFKAEFGVSAEELVERAYRRLLENDLDFIVANDVSRTDIGFCSDFNEVYIVDRRRNVLHIPRSSKREVARGIIRAVLGERHGS